MVTVRCGGAKRRALGNTVQTYIVRAVLCSNKIFIHFVKERAFLPLSLALTQALFNQKS